MNALNLVLVVISHNISFVGKTWWVLMVGLRLLVVLLAGFTLFSDEQERFVCNTLQPGCANVCFDLQAPVSLFRLWLLHILLLCLPHLVFATHVAHELLWRGNLGSAGLGAPHGQGSCRGSPCSTPEPHLSHHHHLLLLHHQHQHQPHPPHQHQFRPHHGQEDAAPRWVHPPVPSFRCAYLLVVTARVLWEAAFAAGHFLFFGLSVPRSFLCYEVPCTSGVECYVSRPTEKTLMLHLMLGLAVLSVLLSLADLVDGARAALRFRRTREMSVSEETSKGEQSSVFSSGSGTDDTNLLLSKGKTAGNGFGSDLKPVPSAYGAPTLAKANGGVVGEDEKNPPRNHNGTGEVGPSTKPKAGPPPGHFVLHEQQKPPEPAGPERGGPPPRLESFTPASTRRQGQLVSVGSSSSSRKNSAPSEAADKRAWV